MSLWLKMPENTRMQPSVDKVQGVVGGYVKGSFANLRPANLGGGTDDNS